MRQLSKAFAAKVAVIAITGLMGLMFYMVTSRTKEIDIRIAVGATKLSIVALFVRSGLLPLTGGAFLGHTSTSFFERSFQNISISISVAALVIVSGSIACAIPALSAVRMDAWMALRLI